MIDVKIGDALANLKAWPADKKFDMVFVDADKGSYQAYYDTAGPGLSPGGAVVAYNVLFKGAPYVGPSKFDNRRLNPSSSPPAPPAVEVASDAVVSGVGNKPILDRMRLDGKAALVTGAGQGIGRAFAHAPALARQDKADCGDPAAIACMVDTVVEKFGAIDIAVNNAGVNKNSAAEDTPLSDWDLTLNLNTLAPGDGDDAALPPPPPPAPLKPAAAASPSRSTNASRCAALALPRGPGGPPADEPPSALLPAALADCATRGTASASANAAASATVATALFGAGLAAAELARYAELRARGAAAREVAYNTGRFFRPGLRALAMLHSLR
ncbi:O-methyltransferase [Aureococcus anophagefferens]|nr:O-methyltransferase [Aureococcus anophagefferens]